MNEVIFIAHALTVTFFTLGALWAGKEALIALVALEAVLANLLVVKQITLFGLCVTCTDVFSIGCILGINLVNEYYGKKAAKWTIWCSFISVVFFGLMSQVHLAYVPSSFDTTQIHFVKLLQPVPRLLVASITAYFISSQFDVWFYSFLKSRVSFAIRSVLAISITQLLDTVLFSFLGLYGILHSVMDIIVVSYVIKLIVISISTPFSILTRRFFIGQSNEEV